MSRCVEALDQKFYPTSGNNWDDALFRQSILTRLSDDSVILDVGAGAGIVEQMNFRGVGARACGIDLDPRVLENPFLDEAKVCSAEKIPYASATFDAVVSDNVLEHLDEPDIVFAEVARVLKPGGVFLFKTPNRRHYMPLIARLTPHGFHGFINRLRGREAVDTFPTRYRANSARQLQRLAVRSGLSVDAVDFFEGRPEYMRISCLLYPFGILYERLVNRFAFLKSFRILIVGALVKPSSGETTE